VRMLHLMMMTMMMASTTTAAVAEWEVKRWVRSREDRLIVSSSPSSSTVVTLVVVFFCFLCCWVVRMLRPPHSLLSSLIKKNRRWFSFSCHRKAEERYEWHEKSPKGVSVDLLSPTNWSFRQVSPIEEDKGEGQRLVFQLSSLSYTTLTFPSLRVSWVTASVADERGDQISVGKRKSLLYFSCPFPTRPKCSECTSRILVESHVEGWWKWSKLPNAGEMVSLERITHSRRRKEEL
jgi:hypothetical protein